MNYIIANKLRNSASRKAITLLIYRENYTRLSILTFSFRIMPRSLLLASTVSLGLLSGFIFILVVIFSIFVGDMGG